MAPPYRSVELPVRVEFSIVVPPLPETQIAPPVFWTFRAKVDPVMTAGLLLFATTAAATPRLLTLSTKVESLMVSAPPSISRQAPAAALFLSNVQRMMLRDLLYPSE